VVIILAVVLPVWWGLILGGDASPVGESCTATSYFTCVGVCLKHVNTSSSYGADCDTWKLSPQDPRQGEKNLDLHTDQLTHTTTNCR